MPGGRGILRSSKAKNRRNAGALQDFLTPLGCKSPAHTASIDYEYRFLNQPVRLKGAPPVFKRTGCGRKGGQIQEKLRHAKRESRKGPSVSAGAMGTGCYGAARGRLGSDAAAPGQKACAPRQSGCAFCRRGHPAGADDEARTRYLHLGKVALYQMSYARMSEGYYNPMRVDCQGLCRNLSKKL